MPRLARSVAIIGGGIAGTALAIALARRGVRVCLIEREPQWVPVSSGIFIYTNGLHALHRLGVLPAICEAGWVSPDGGNLYLSADAREIVRTTYPQANGSIPAIVGMRRLALHQVLSQAIARLDVDVRLGVTVAAIDDTDAARPVTLALSDGKSVTCDVLVGADGIRSQIRRHLFEEIEPTYTGFGVWRSVHAKPLEIDTKIMMMGLGTRLGIMPISRDQLYIFGTTREPGKPYYAQETWRDLMRAKFAEFKGPGARFLDEVAGGAEVFYTAIEEIQLPLPWSRGRTIVIGDAAHSSAPFMGQGGAMALEDAVVLADMLVETTDIAGTLEQFGRRRFERCKFVQDVSRRVGEAGATEDAETLKTRDQRMRSTAQQDVDGFYARMLQPI